MVANAGNVTYEVKGDLAVTTTSGEPYANLRMEPAGLFVAPGEEVTLEAVWEDPPLIGVFNARADIDAVIKDRIPRNTQSNSVEFWIIPWTEILALVGAIGLIVWTLLTTRHRRQQWGRHRREERELIREHRGRRMREGSNANHDARPKSPARHSR